MIPIAQVDAGAAVAWSGFFALAVFVFGALLLVAPLGIWNRLVKIHRGQIAAEKARAAHEKAALDKLDSIMRLTAQLVAIERDRP